MPGPDHGHIVSLPSGVYECQYVSAVELNDAVEERVTGDTLRTDENGEIIRIMRAIFQAGDEMPGWGLKKLEDDGSGAYVNATLSEVDAIMGAQNEGIWNFRLENEGEDVSVKLQGEDVRRLHLNLNCGEGGAVVCNIYVSIGDQYTFHHLHVFWDRSLAGIKMYRCFNDVTTKDPSVFADAINELGRAFGVVGQRGLLPAM